MKLSEAMVNALRYMLADSNRCLRLPGGFWTTPGLAVGLTPTGAPRGWWTTAHTMGALARRGLVRRADGSGPEWAQPYEVTDAGRAALEATHAT